MDEGLSSYDVRALCQDQQGFLWIGTSFGGLNRFDGYEFKSYRYDEKDPESLSHNYVWCTLVDSKGRLWVGTAGGGLNRYVEERDGFVRYQAVPGSPLSLLNNAVLSLLEDKEGTLWIGTRGGLNSLDPTTGVINQHPIAIKGAPKMNMRTIRCIAEDPAGSLLWLGTSDGLFAYDRKSQSFQGYTSDGQNAAGIGYNSINSILPTADGKLWLATEQGLCLFTIPSRSVPQGLHPFETVQWEVHLIDAPSSGVLSRNAFRSAVLDGNGGIWLGASDGLSRFDISTGSFTLMRTAPGAPDSLSSNVINKLFMDRQGGLWVGTTFGGVNRLRSEGKSFRNHTQVLGAEESGLTHPIATAILVDSRQRLWVGTIRGLNCLEKGKWTHYLNDPNDPGSLSANHISSLAEDAAGDIWVGTPNQGINRFDGSVFHHYINRAPLQIPPFGRLPYTSSQIGTLFLDPKNRLWINGRGYGLDYYDRGEFVHRSPVDEAGRALPFANLIPGYLDEDDGLWCASELNGLVRVHVPSGTTEQYFPGAPKGRSTQAIQSYAVTSDGAQGLWVATISGLHHFDLRSRSFDRSVFASDGLPSDAVLFVTRDHSGLLWLSTTNGLCRFDPLSNQCRNYEKADGLPSNQFLMTSGFCASDGRLYFGSLNGVCSFDPGQLRDNPTPPASIVLSDFELFDEAVTPRSQNSPLRTSIGRTQALTLSASQSVFCLKFSALDYDAPTRSQYSYRMLGLDDEWRTGARRDVYYMNLPPGEYTFQVRGANADNIWSTGSVSLAITVLPHWYASALFRWTVSLLLFGLVFYLVRLRLRRIRQRTRELSRIVAERTRDLEQEVRERKTAEEALRESHAYLEARVAMRTAQLAESNTRLQGEVEERKRVELDLRQSQEHLRQSQKMEAFGQLAGGISHDFNNILTVIIGQSQASLQEGCTDAERLESIKEIQDAAQRATHLTRQLLVFSRKQAIDRKPLDLRQVVGELTRMLRRIIGEDIALRMSLTEEPHPIVGDAAMIEQVLINMAVNARDAMPRGGELHIELSLHPIGDAVKGEHPGCPRVGTYSRIGVRDTGSGIDRATLPRIFEPFFTTKEAGRGTGLGLATSQSIIHQHEGWIEVESVVGLGTEFSIYLPLAQPAMERVAASPAARLPVQAYPQGDSCILLVEDEPGVRRSTSRMLQRHGYRVIEAENADHALALWKDLGDSVDLLLTDIVMPGSLNGHALAKQLGALRPGLRILLMSGYDPTQLATRSLEGAKPLAPILTKPFSIDELLGMVRARLGQPGP